MSISEGFSTDYLDDLIEESGILPDVMDKTFKLPDEWFDRHKTIQKKESPSSIPVYLECPMKWYIHRYAPLEWGEPQPAPYLISGTVVHRMAEVFMSEPPEKRTDDMLDTIKWRCQDILDDTSTPVEEQAKDGILSQQDIEEWRFIQAKIKERRTNQWMQAVLDSTWKIIDGVLDIDNDPTAIDVVATEQYLNKWINGIRIGAKIDRIIGSEDGGIIIDDYKTGKDPGEKEAISILTKRYLQLGIYAWIVTMNSKMGGESAVEAVRLLFLKVPSFYRINMKPETIPTVNRLLDIITKEMSTIFKYGQVEAAPDPKDRKTIGSCSDCAIKGICPARGETTDLQETLDILKSRSEEEAD